ncbi:hypothetical protein PMAYCL1PPCAC_26409, partial [Pristionchus mayeri]
ISSIILTAICVIIVNRSSSVTRAYSKLLILLLLGSTVADVFIQWVYDPVFMFPRLCVYRNAPFINIPFSAALGHSVLFSMIASGGPIYISLFVYRHQALLLPGSRLKFSLRAQAIFAAALCVPYCTIGISIYV